MLNLNQHAVWHLLSFLGGERGQNTLREETQLTQKLNIQASECRCWSIYFICGPSPCEKYLGPGLLAITERLAFGAHSNGQLCVLARQPQPASTDDAVLSVPPGWLCGLEAEGCRSRNSPGPGAGAGAGAAAAGASFQSSPFPGALGCCWQPFRLLTRGQRNCDVAQITIKHAGDASVEIAL